MQEAGHPPDGVSVLPFRHYFAFKTIPHAVAALCVYLGYRLFVLGVTGQASLSVDAKSVKGQLLNAAPGLFFAVGGIAIEIATIIKGIAIEVDHNAGKPRRKSGPKNTGGQMVFRAGASHVYTGDDAE